MYNEVIKLIAEHKTVDEYGDMQITTSERVVFADVRSIGTKEFYQAQAVGMQPEIKFVLSDYLDYQGEQALKYRGYADVEKEYSVIRTYRNGNELEIVAKRGVDA